MESGRARPVDPFLSPIQVISGKPRWSERKTAEIQTVNRERRRNEEQEYCAPFYAETLLGIIRRSGLAPGIGNCMCQKFVSGEMNSTPIYCLPSRARWIETTRHSIDCVV